METDFVDFVVCGDFCFGEWSAIDAESVVLSDWAGCERVDEKVFRTWRFLKPSVCVESRIFVEEGSVWSVVILLYDNVSVSGTWRCVGTVRYHICKAAEFLKDEHCRDVVRHQGNVWRAVLISRIGQPIEPCCGECLDEADDFYGELAA